MAQPLQYQSQFIPTNFGVVGDALGMFRQDMQQRNQEFDQAAAMEDMALAKMAEEQTSDPVKQKQLIEDLRSRIEDVVQKRGGDYGAASKDISRLIAKERTNPWYGYDRKRLTKAQEEAKLKQLYGINYYSPKSYSDISLDDYLADPTSFDYQPTNLEPVLKEMEDWAKAESALKTEDVNEDIDPFTKKVGTRTGYNTPELRDQFIEEKGSQMIDDLLGRIGIDDPQIRSRLEQTILNNIGGDERVSITPNYQARESAKRTAELQKAGMPLLSHPDIDIVDKKQKFKEDFDFLRSGLKDGKFSPSSVGGEENELNPVMKGVVYDFMDEVTNNIGIPAYNLAMNILQMEDKQRGESKYWTQKGHNKRTINKYEVMKDAYIAEYRNLYDSIPEKVEGKDNQKDAKFLEMVEQIEIANSAMKSSSVSISDPGLAKNVFVNVEDVFEGKKARTFINKETGKGITRKVAEDRLGSAPLSVRINSNGMMTVLLPNKKEDAYEEYIIDPEAMALEFSTKEDNEDFNKIKNTFKRFDISPEEAVEINGKGYMFEGSPYTYKMYINPNDPLDRAFQKILGKDENGEFVTAPASYDEIFGLMALNKFKTIKGK